MDKLSDKLSDTNYIVMSGTVFYGPQVSSSGASVRFLLRNRQHTIQGKPFFINISCTAFGKAVQRLPALKAGDAVLVEGRYNVNRKEETPGYVQWEPFLRVKRVQLIEETNKEMHS